MGYMVYIYIYWFLAEYDPIIWWCQKDSADVVYVVDYSPSHLRWTRQIPLFPHPPPIGCGCYNSRGTLWIGACAFRLDMWRVEEVEFLLGHIPPFWMFLHVAFGYSKRAARSREATRQSHTLSGSSFKKTQERPWSKENIRKNILFFNGLIYSKSIHCNAACFLQPAMIQGILIALFPPQFC